MYRVITSEITGRTYEISVALPRGYDESADTYPVLYTTDANGSFGTIVEATRILRIPDEVPELINVGVGYPLGRFWNVMSPRSTDLTPTSDSEWEKEEALKWPQLPAPEGSGGAPEFLRFVKEELVPIIDRDYRTDTNDRALVGHSFGGLFATYALLQGDGTFNKYLISSPSYWWDDRSTFKHEETFSQSGNESPARIFFSVGLQEEAPRDETMAPYQMVTNLREFMGVLETRTYPWTYHAEFFADENHNSVFFAAASRGLRYLYKD